MSRYKPSPGSEEKIDLLIDQVGRLTEVIIVGFQDMREEFQQMRVDMREDFQQMRVDMREDFQQMRVDMREDFQQMRVDMTELKQITERQAQVAEQQAASVARLAAIVENLIQRDAERGG